jgi:hypothetical protein
VRSLGVAECHSGTRLSRFSVTRFIAVTFIVALVSIPAAAHAQTTQSRIDSTNATIEATAQRWFDAQNRAAQLDVSVKQVEGELRAAQAHVAKVRVIATARAIELYKGVSVDYTGMLGSTAIESARRLELIDSANATSEDALNALTKAVSDLNAQHKSLLSQQAAQQQTLQDISQQRATLDSELANFREQLALRRAVQPHTVYVPTAQAPAEAPPTAPAATTIRVLSPTILPIASTSGVNPHHDDPFLVCTRMRESTNRYTAVSPSGYYGAYQFLPSTWDVTAIRAGRRDLIGVLPTRASEYDQDQMAWTLYLWQGNTPWGGRC